MIDSTFFVETYAPRLDRATAAEFSSRLHAAVADLQREGCPVECVYAVALPDDETYVWILRAADVADVVLLAARARLACDHITQALGQDFAVVAGRRESKAPASHVPRA